MKIFSLIFLLITFSKTLSAQDVGITHLFNGLTFSPSFTYAGFDIANYNHNLKLMQAEAYGANEFHPAVRTLLRFGIITVGAFPVSFSVGMLVLGVTNLSQLPMERQIELLLMGSTGVALTIALIDFLLGLRRP
ncbi:MAG: hypothetical protein FWE37_02935 [Spirochaetaceae bacterium]|nr:hypothetical protein [Spirochaetaceae bacterium]